MDAGRKRKKRDEMRIQKILLALGMTGLLLGEAGSGHPTAARAHAVKPARDEAADSD